MWAKPWDERDDIDMGQSWEMRMNVGRERYNRVNKPGRSREM